MTCQTYKQRENIVMFGLFFLFLPHYFIPQTGKYWFQTDLNYKYFRTVTFLSNALLICWDVLVCTMYASDLLCCPNKVCCWYQCKGLNLNRHVWRSWHLSIFMKKDLSVAIYHFFFIFLYSMDCVKRFFSFHSKNITLAIVQPKCHL